MGKKPELRRCAKCGADKPVLDFNKRARSKDGLRPTCKTCDRVTRMRWEGKPTSGAGLETLDGLGEGGGAAPPAPPPKVIGSIGPAFGMAPGGPSIRIREVAVGAIEAAEQAAADEYSALLNQKLSIRQRANLMVKIAKNIKGPSAALALQALKDINIATKVTSRTGVQLDLGPMFMLPDGPGMKMSGS